MKKNQDARRNYPVLLWQGIFSSAATELTSVKLVLPFLYMSVGGPVIFAGMLVPVSTIAKRGVQVLVAPLVVAARSNRGFMVIPGVAAALALALISLTFNVVGTYWLVPIFLFAALVIGAAGGLGALAFQDLIGRVLSDERRRQLLFTQSSLAGLFVVVVAIGSQILLKPGTSFAAHQELIWLGIGLFVLSALVTIAIREPVADQPPVSATTRENRTGQIAALRDSFRLAFALDWFGRFLIARTLYLSIELAIPFYSIHAATFHGNSITGLNVFVIAANIGLMAGGLLWARIGKRSVAVILSLAAALTCIGGLLALAIEMRLMPQNIYLYGVVFVLVSLGATGVKNGRTLYLIGAATDEQRPFCIAVANVTIGLVAIGVGGILGLLASYRGVAWPILALIVLNVLAALYTLKLRDVRRAQAAKR